MWLLGGAVMVAVCSALLAAADLRLHQHVDDVGSTEVFQCYDRYVRASHQPGVLVMHDDYAHVARYLASIRSPVTIINLGPFNISPMLVEPRFESALLQWIAMHTYGLMVALVKTQKELFIFAPILERTTINYLDIRVLVVGLTSEFGTLLHGIFYVADFARRTNVAVLPWNDTRVYTHFPYAGGACGRRWVAEELGQCQQLTLDQLFPDKEPKRFGGCPVQMTLLNVQPAVIDFNSDSEQPLVAGYEVALVNVIFRRLNLTKAVAPGNMMFSSCQTEYPYYIDTMAWHIPAAAPRAQWKSVVLVFQAQLWTAVLAFFLLNSLAWWLMGRVCSTPGAGAASYVQCALESLRVLLNSSVPLPGRTPLRFLVVSWTLCALVLMAAYQSQLLSVLLTPVNDEQLITNEQELFASDVPLDRTLIGDTFFFLRQKWDPILSHERKTRGRSNKTPALLLYSLTAKYLAKNYTDARGKSTLVAFEQPTKYLPLCVRIYKPSPFSVATNQMMRRLVENGIVAKFMRDVDFSGFWTPGEREDEPLTMRHLDFAFLVLLLGCALATLAFLQEVVVWRTVHVWWPALCRLFRRGRRACRTRGKKWKRWMRTKVREWRRIYSERELRINE